MNERVASIDLSADRREDLDLLSLARVLLDRWLTIAACTVLGGLVAVVMALTMTPVFHAEVVVTEVRDPSMGGGGGLAGQLGGLASLAGMSLNSSGPGNEARAILKSRYLVEEFVKRQKLEQALLQGAPGTPSLWYAVRRFRDDVLAIREDTRQGIVTVAMEWTDAVTAARWANEYVALANEIIRQRALAISGRNVAYLKSQIAQTNVIELQRVMYNLVESETKTLMLANARTEYAFSIVDPAVAPEARISPRRAVIAVFGVAIGLFAGVLVALLMNAWATLRR